MTIAVVIMLIQRLVRRSSIAALVLFLGSGSMPLAFADPAQSIKPAGLTVNFAQVLDWIDNDTFAVGRWDGTISVFRRPDKTKNEFGPMILQAMSTPTGRGIEMLAAVDDTSFFTSDGPGGLALWKRKSTGAPFELAASPNYKQEIGVANSGLALDLNGVHYFVSGHDSGYILIWRRDPNGDFQLFKTVDARSPNTPSNPWSIHNIRGLALWRGDRVISGSEDGDLVAINVLDGRELFRQRYNQTAKRGINAISVVGEKVAVANCAVGPDDKNIWLFDLSSDQPQLLSADNLELDTGRSQVFDFDVDLIAVPSKAGGQAVLTFFSSTEEGLIWEGRIDHDQLVVTGVTRVSPEGAAVMAVAPRRDFIAAAAYAVRLYQTE